MTTTSGRLINITSKIERADKHFEELRILHGRFIASSPYTIASDIDTATGRRFYYVANMKEVEINIINCAGDIIQNLRSALDHLAYQLVCIGKGSDEKNRYVYFPINDSEKEYYSKGLTKIKGATNEAIDIINSIRPYKGGNDILWILHHLNIIDKHRLIIAVGSVMCGVNIGQLLAQKMSELVPDIKLPTSGIDFFLKEEPASLLKTGDKLFIDEVNAEVKEKLQFRFSIVFGEPTIAEGLPFIETIEKMRSTVSGIIDSFKHMIV